MTVTADYEINQERIRIDLTNGINLAKYNVFYYKNSDPLNLIYEGFIYFNSEDPLPKNISSVCYPDYMYIDYKQYIRITNYENTKYTFKIINDSDATDFFELVVDVPNISIDIYSSFGYGLDPSQNIILSDPSSYNRYNLIFSFNDLSANVFDIFYRKYSDVPDISYEYIKIGTIDQSYDINNENYNTFIYILDVSETAEYEFKIQNINNLDDMQTFTRELLYNEIYTKNTVINCTKKTDSNIYEYEPIYNTDGSIIFDYGFVNDISFALIALYTFDNEGNEILVEEKRVITQYGTVIFDNLSYGGYNIKISNDAISNKNMNYTNNKNVSINITDVIDKNALISYINGINNLPTDIKNNIGFIQDYYNFILDLISKNKYNTLSNNLIAYMMSVWDNMLDSNLHLFLGILTLHNNIYQDIQINLNVSPKLNQLINQIQDISIITINNSDFLAYIGKSTIQQLIKKKYFYTLYAYIDNILYILDNLTDKTPYLNNYNILISIKSILLSTTYVPIDNTQIDITVDKSLFFYKYIPSNTNFTNNKLSITFIIRSSFYKRYGINTPIKLYITDKVGFEKYSDIIYNQNTDIILDNLSPEKTYYIKLFGVKPDNTIYTIYENEYIYKYNPYEYILLETETTSPTQNGNNDGKIIINDFTEYIETEKTLKVLDMNNNILGNYTVVNDSFPIIIPNLKSGKYKLHLYDSANTYNEKYVDIFEKDLFNISYFTNINNISDGYSTYNNCIKNYNKFFNLIITINTNLQSNINLLDNNNIVSFLITNKYSGSYYADTTFYFKKTDVANIIGMSSINTNDLANKIIKLSINNNVIYNYTIPNIENYELVKTYNTNLTNDNGSIKFNFNNINPNLLPKITTDIIITDINLEAVYSQNVTFLDLLNNPPANLPSGNLTIKLNNLNNSGYQHSEQISTSEQIEIKTGPILETSIYPITPSNNLGSLEFLLNPTISSDLNITITELKNNKKITKTLLNNNSTIKFDNLVEGLYSIATSNNKVKTDSTVNLFNVSKFDFDYVSINENYENKLDGELLVNVNNGSGFYNYKIYTDISGNDMLIANIDDNKTHKFIKLINNIDNNFTLTKYKLSVTDLKSTNVSKTKNIDINYNYPLTISNINTTYDLINKGKNILTFDILNGRQNFEYTLKNMDTLISSKGILLTKNAKINNLIAGNYKLTLKDYSYPSQTFTQDIIITQNTPDFIQLETPKINYNCNDIESFTKISFNWHKIENADYYQINFYDKNNLIHKCETANLNFNLNTVFIKNNIIFKNINNVFIDIIAKSNQSIFTESEKSNKLFFIINEPQNNNTLTVPKILSKNNTKNNIYFNWLKVKNADSYIIYGYSNYSIHPAKKWITNECYYGIKNDDIYDFAWSIPNKLTYFKVFAYNSNKNIVSDISDKIIFS